MTVVKTFTIRLNFDVEPVTADTDLKWAISEAIQKAVDEGFLTDVDEQAVFEGFSVERG